MMLGGCCAAYRSSVALCSSDAPDGPQRGHGPQTPTLEAEPHQRRHPVPLGPGVDGGSGRPIGLGSPPPPVEAVRHVGPVCAEGLCVSVGGLKPVNQRERSQI